MADRSGGSRGRRWLRAGVVGTPHGLDGSFHVRAPNPELLVAGRSISISGHELRIERRAGSDRRVIVRVAGYGDRAAAQSLRGEEMLVARDQAAELGPDEWWAEDLEGCLVNGIRQGQKQADVPDGGRVVGLVRRLIALPSCEALEVVRTEGPPDLLVPLVRDAVRSVDLERRLIEVDLGFLDEH